MTNKPLLLIPGACLLTALLSCFPAAPTVPPSQPPRQNSIQTIPPPRIIQGKPGFYRIHIENHSDRPIILLEVKPAASHFPVNRDEGPEQERIQEGSAHRWTHRLSGRISYTSDEDRFVLQPRSSRLTYIPEQMLYSGLTVPGERVTAKLRGIYQNPGPMEQEFVLRYVLVGRNQLIDRAYVPEQSVSSRLNRSKVVFSKPPNPSMSALAEEQFLLLHPEFSIINERTFSRTITVHKRPFSREKALDRFKREIGEDVTVQEVHFAPWLESWILLAGAKRLWSVTPSEVSRLPGLTMNHVRTLSSQSGPVTFYLDDDLQSDGGDFERIDRLLNLDGTVRNRETWTSPRPRAAKQIARLRKENVLLKWIREPLTNRNVVYVRGRN